MIHSILYALVVLEHPNHLVQFATSFVMSVNVFAVVPRVAYGMRLH